MEGSKESTVEVKPLPKWLRRSPGSSESTRPLKKILRQAKLNTVCEEARCPNISECFARGTATFMILGDVCTRGCRFCSVQTGKPLMHEADFSGEAKRVAEAAVNLGLKHVVVTSVARDDLEDGGASGFVATIASIRHRLPNARVEVLIPDFRGNKIAIDAVIEARPDVINHNLETVPRLYRKVRPGSVYQRSLKLLEYVKQRDANIVTKTGIMLGLGERDDEVVSVMKDARAHNIEIFTAGQYLRPTREHLPVVEYLQLEQFVNYESIANKLGFSGVFIGPLVRSSYHADEQSCEQPAV